MYVIVFRQNADEHQVNHWITNNIMGFTALFLLIVYAVLGCVLELRYDFCEVIDVVAILMSNREMQLITDIHENLSHSLCIFFLIIFHFPNQNLLLISDAPSLLVASPNQNSFFPVLCERERKALRFAGRDVLLLIIFLPLRRSNPFSYLAHFLSGLVFLRLVF